MREDGKQVWFVEGTASFEVLAASKEEAIQLLKENLVFRLGNDIEAGMLSLIQMNPNSADIKAWDATEEVRIYGTNINQLRSY